MSCSGITRSIFECICTLNATPKWKGCAEKIPKYQNSLGETRSPHFLFPSIALGRVCKRVGVIWGRTTPSKDQDDTLKCRNVFHLEIKDLIVWGSVDLVCKDKRI